MRSGFTLIEFLVIIGILAVLTGIGIGGYSLARQRAELELAQDRVVTTLSASQAEVRQGFSDVSGISACRGVLFTTGVPPVRATVPFTAGQCDSSAHGSQVLLPFSSSLSVTSLSAHTRDADTPLSALAVWYAPPDGHMVTSVPGDTFLVTIGSSDNGATLFPKRISLDALTGTARSL